LVAFPVIQRQSALPVPGQRGGVLLHLRVPFHERVLDATREEILRSLLVMGFGFLGPQRGATKKEEGEEVFHRCRAIIPRCRTFASPYRRSATIQSGALRSHGAP